MPPANQVCVDFAIMVSEWHSKLLAAGLPVTAKLLKDAENKIGWEAAERIGRERREDLKL
jgi:hypothetical protein